MEIENVDFYIKFLNFVSSDEALIITFIATVISIILGICSIVYSYISNKETAKLLIEIRDISKKIENDNKILVEEIRKELIKDNFGPID